MFAEKILAVGLLIASAATAAATLGQQDWIAISGTLTVLGLAGINLYQKFREKKREQDAADLALQATSSQARIITLEERNDDLTRQIASIKSEAVGWQKLYEARMASDHRGRGT